MKKILVVCALVTLLTLLVAACGGGTTSSGGGSGSSGDSSTVGLAATNFTQSSITIQKGQSITLSNQTGITHIISNGSWNGNTPAPKTESGAPVVNNMTFNSANQTQTVGPFNAAGTFHYYCSIHPGMNLTVVVQ